MMYGWLLAILMGVATFGVGAWKNNTIDRLDEVIASQQKLLIAKEVIELANQVEITECKDINIANTKAQLDLKAKVKVAMDLVAKANTTIMGQELDIAKQSKEFRESADDQCYKMDGDELPTDFVDSVYNYSIN